MDLIPDTVWGMPVWLGILVGCSTMFGAFQVYYWVGRVLGEKLYESRIGERIGRHRIDRIERLVRRWGALAVFGCYWVPVLRHTLPWCAGVVRVAYPWYLVASGLGALLWTTPWLVGGYAVAWALVEVTARSPVAGVALTLAVVAAVVAFVIVRRRRRVRVDTNLP